MPAQVPLEYDLLRDLPVPLLRNRLVLLHYFSDLLAPIVSMLPLEGEINLGKLRGILVYSAKESLFRKVSIVDRAGGKFLELVARVLYWIDEDEGIW